jgi:hypothetical protein
VAISLDPADGRADVIERVSWTNPGPASVSELVFTAHAHARLTRSEADAAAKMLELVRVAPADALDSGPALDVEKVELRSDTGEASAGDLAWRFRTDGTTLEVTLPRPIAPGECVIVDMHFGLRLPNKQGRWGRWRGVTTLCGCLPTLAAFDGGWKPAPFLAWYQPVHQEAGVYRVRVRCPRDLVIAAPLVNAEKTTHHSPLTAHQETTIGPLLARDFGFAASDRYREFTADAGPVHVRVLAFPEHSAAARRMLEAARVALLTYAEWFGPYPYAEFTIAESYLGWNARATSGLALIDERVFALPGFAAGFAEFLVAQQVAQQWWYGLVGTDGATEPYLDAGLAAYAAHRLLDRTRGRNNPLIRYPTGFGWLPAVGREDLRMSLLGEPLARGELAPAAQDVTRYDDPARIWGQSVERGAKVFGMIEARIGDDAFLAFTRRLAERYRFRILRTTDLRRELEETTGKSWEDFFREWVFGTGVTDWAVESVIVQESEARSEPRPSGSGRGLGPFTVTVLLRQKGEINEPTVLGFRFAGDENYSARLPIDPSAGDSVISVAGLSEAGPGSTTLATVEPLANGEMRVTIELPWKPEQVAVDPDGVLLDRDPSNNTWKSDIRWHLTPFYTFLDETDLTCAHDRWNLIAGPWYFDPNYGDPWFTRAAVLGARVGAYRTQQFQGGLYAGWRPDYRDLAAGADITLPHWPLPKTEVGFNVEHHLVELGEGGANLNRGAAYCRYIFDDTASFYLPPMHYLESFAAHQNDFLPDPRLPTPGATRFDTLSTTGLHYHLDLLTPYWDPDRGVRLDTTLAAGVPVLCQREQSWHAVGSLSAAQALPDWLDPLSETRLAVRLYGAAALPDRGQFYSLGGSQLFRGFDMRERQGSAVWVGSAEWRVPICRHTDWELADHAVELRQVALAPFCDVGNAYVERRGLGPVACAVGAGLRCDVAWLSFVERTTMRFDVAKTINAPTATQFWFGIQHPF